MGIREVAEAIERHEAPVGSSLIGKTILAVVRRWSVGDGNRVYDIVDANEQKASKQNKT